MSVNKVILIGNLGKDAETRTPGNGERAVINFTLATSERYRAQDGELKEDTTWHNIVYWTKAGTNLPGYLTKGTTVYVEGQISNRQYTDQQGVTKYITEIKASRLDLISPKQQSAVSSQPGGYQQNGIPVGYQQPQNNPQGFQQTGQFPQQPVNHVPMYEVAQQMTQQAPQPQRVYNMPPGYENLPDGF